MSLTWTLTMLIACLVFDLIMCLLIRSQEYSEKMNLMKKFKSFVIWYHLCILRAQNMHFEKKFTAWHVILVYDCVFLGAGFKYCL